MIVEARLLDLEKAYPRVNKHCLWEMLKRCGLEGPFWRTIEDLHETTMYKVIGREGCSEPWHPQRGLREGCPTSPVLFNIYHQTAMRLAEKRRREEAKQQGLTTGIEWCFMKGNNLPGQCYERFNSEATGHLFTCSVFANDTTLLGEEKEMEMAVPLTKELMMSFEEKSNDDKKERMVFGGGGGRRRRPECWDAGWELPRI